MKVLYSFFSIVLTFFILLGCLILDALLSKKVIYELLVLINKGNIFNINIIFFIFALVFLCSFVIIFLLFIKKNSKYIASSFLASGICVIFFTLFFSRFNIVKNFYFASNDFSSLVKNSFRNIAITNFLVGFLLILITIIYFIRRNKNEKEF